MGKITGFMEYERIEEGYKPVARAPQALQGIRHRPGRRAGQGAGRALHGLRHAVLQQRLPGQQHHSGLQRPGVPRRLEERARRCCTRTNNFPEFTGRICPAPCEAACTLNVNDDPVGIKSIEHAIIDRAWENGWVAAAPAAHKTGKKVAVVGSGPAGMAAAQQLARAGHDVTLFEKNDRIGGLLRYGIPDFKMEKVHIDRRVEQMKAEGVTFRTGVMVGELPKGSQGHQLGQGNHHARAAAEGLRRRAADRRRRAVARPAGARPRAGRHPLRDGVPAAAEQGQRRRQGQGPAARRRQARHRHRRRRHRLRLRRHQQPPRRGQRDPVRADAAAARGGEQAADLALLADQAAHQLQPRGRLRARVRHLHQGIHRREAARSPA